MKTKFVSIVLLLFSSMLFAQDRTIVNATNSEISDNLDLRAVASIFGDSQNLEDFERRLNDPQLQISNLDLNNDNQVDYLRVIESIQGYTHLIIIQAVLSQDVYQDIATIEIEKNQRRNVQVQIVGNPYFYGANYIYEPVYINQPIFYNYFWVRNYRPYYPRWNWGYYPSYYIAWNPFPIFRYRRHMEASINFNYQYRYSNERRSTVAVNLYNTRRSYGYERENPTRSFEVRHNEVRNRYEFDKVRNDTRDLSAPRTNDVRNNNGNTGTPRNNTNPSGTSTINNHLDSAPRNTNPTPRTNSPIDPASTEPRNTNPTPRATPSGNTNTNDQSPRINTPRTTNQNFPNPRSNANPRNSDSPSNPRIISTPRTIQNPRNNNTPRAEMPKQQGRENPNRGR